MTIATNATNRAPAESTSTIGRLALTLGAFARRAIEQAGTPYLNGSLPPL